MAEHLGSFISLPLKEATALQTLIARRPIKLKDSCDNVLPNITISHHTTGALAVPWQIQYSSQRISKQSIE